MLFLLPFAYFVIRCRVLFNVYLNIVDNLDTFIEVPVLFFLSSDFTSAPRLTFIHSRVSMCVKCAAVNIYIEVVACLPLRQSFFSVNG